MVNALIYRQIPAFYPQCRERPLIHKNHRIKLWTTPNFLSGSSALAIGYFLLNFFAIFPALARKPSPHDGVRVLKFQQLINAFRLTQSRQSMPRVHRTSTQFHRWRERIALDEDGV